LNCLNALNLCWVAREIERFATMSRVLMTTRSTRCPKCWPANLAARWPRPSLVPGREVVGWSALPIGLPALALALRTRMINGARPRPPAFGRCPSSAHSQPLIHCPVGTYSRPIKSAGMVPAKFPKVPGALTSHPTSARTHTMNTKGLSSAGVLRHWITSALIRSVFRRCAPLRRN
jgi:hypothetical protein